jgi:hypothetical protein
MMPRDPVRPARPEDADAGGQAGYRDRCAVLSAQHSADFALEA